MQKRDVFCCDEIKYKCICGKEHVMTPLGIRCSGRGHQVYLSPKYFEYSLKEELKKINNQQLKLF